MIITISGKPGSGKSTIGKMLAEKYRLKYYSTGDFFRKKAKEKNLTLKEYSILAEKNKEQDNETDKWQTDLGEKENDFVIEGRLGHKFIKNSIKIYLDIDKEVGAMRIMNENRVGELPLNKEHALELWQHRVDSEHHRYKSYYNIDIHDFLKYDLVLDTSDMTIDQVLDKVCRFVDERTVY